jgi:hypothetical protein
MPCQERIRCLPLRRRGRRSVWLLPPRSLDRQPLPQPLLQEDQLTRLPELVPHQERSDQQVGLVVVQRRFPACPRLQAQAPESFGRFQQVLGTPQRARMFRSISR